MEKRKLEINEENVRLDKFIMNSISDLSRTLIQEYIKEGHVLVNGKIEKASYKIKMNDAIEITIPDNKEMDVLPEDIPLDIVYEDQDVIVVNKPSGMIVHPSVGIYSGTLVNALLYHCKDLSGINGVNRPGIVHRIDKETSGLLMVAKNDKAHKSLSEQLKEHSVTRRYVALVHGVIPHVHGKVNAPIGRDVNDRQKMAVTKNNSKEAITNFTVLERYDDMSLIECRLETGRTHQIRVHMSYIGYPVYGDPKYGKKKDDQFLDIVSKILKEYDYNLEVKYTKKKGHASKIVKELPDNVDLVISAGGDGTYNEVVSGDLKRENKLLIANLPLGTTNDVGKMFGYGKNVINNLKLLMDGVVENIDICTICPNENDENIDTFRPPR